MLLQCITRQVMTIKYKNATGKFCKLRIYEKTYSQSMHILYNSWDV